VNELTPREQRILALDINLTAVTKGIKDIKTKLKVQHRKELVALAQESTK
jgi:DNA-binding CsgD family transcriptional regulator